MSSAIVLGETIVGTMLSARMVGLTGVAVIETERLAQLELPAIVDRAFIAMDTDPSDESIDAAATLAKRAALFGVDIALLRPPIGHATWRAFGEAQARSAREARRV